MAAGQIHLYQYIHLVDHSLSDTAKVNAVSLILSFRAVSEEAVQNSLVDCNPVMFLGSSLGLSLSLFLLPSRRYYFKKVHTLRVSLYHLFTNYEEQNTKMTEQLTIRKNQP